MALEDVGEKPEELKPPSKKTTYYPSITIKNDYGPEWSEEPFEARAQLKFTGFSKGRDEKTYSCHFDILKLDLSKAPYKDEGEKKPEDWQLKDRGKDMGLEEEGE